MTGGATIVKLRAFVAGSGDMRRVQAIVSETFTEQHSRSRRLRWCRWAALPLEGAQVVLESIAVAQEGCQSATAWFSSRDSRRHRRQAAAIRCAAGGESRWLRLRTAVKAAGSGPARRAARHLFSQLARTVSAKCAQMFAAEYPRRRVEFRADPARAGPRGGGVRSGGEAPRGRPAEAAGVC